MVEIPKIVNWRMRAVAKPQEHPDPNLLSAFVEHSLGKRDRVQVLQHLYACPDCREIVSRTATQMDTTDVVSSVRANSAWLSWPILRWGVVAACVVVVGAVVTLRQEQSFQRISHNDVTGVTGQVSQLTPHNLAAQTEPQYRDATPASSSPVITANQREAQGAWSPHQNPRTTAAAPIEMADSRPGPDFASMVPGRSKNALAESPQPEVDQAMSQPDFGEDADFISQATPLGALTPRWTLNSDGTLQRSLDSGRSWQAISVTKLAIFRALAANGLDIWVGGLAGALYHSSDAGQHWSQVQPVVNGEMLGDDLIRVEFTDTLHGKLSTSNDEAWTTADGGKTWQKQ